MKWMGGSNHYISSNGRSIQKTTTITSMVATFKASRSQRIYVMLWVKWRMMSGIQSVILKRSRQSFLSRSTIAESQQRWIGTMEKAGRDSQHDRTDAWLYLGGQVRGIVSVPDEMSATNDVDNVVDKTKASGFFRRLFGGKWTKTLVSFRCRNVYTFRSHLIWLCRSILN